MKKILLLPFFVLLCISCCHFSDDEPMGDKEELLFSSQGGEEIVSVLKRSGEEYEQAKAPWFYQPSSKYEGLDTLKFEDGGIRYYNEWVSFTISADYKTIKVSVKENKTAKDRLWIFEACGYKRGFYIFVRQKK